MTTISAHVVADSLGPNGQRIISILGRYPRWIHAEQRTHRLMRTGEPFPEELPTPSIMEQEDMSRNASSSRAIPVKRLIDDIRRDPAIPIYWGANQKGMQAGEECTERVAIDTDNGGWDKVSREAAWLHAMDNAIRSAECFDDAGYAKQIVNRLLEPFSHINILLTATNWKNFFWLRDHKDAEPHIRDFAVRCKEAIQASDPKQLGAGQWHVPFVRDNEVMDVGENSLDDEAKWATVRQLSAARCARLSYLTYEGKTPQRDEDLALYNRLVRSDGNPVHASPLEHQASPDFWDEAHSKWKRPHLHGNLEGFIQFRKLVPGEAAA